MKQTLTLVFALLTPTLAACGTTAEAAPSIDLEALAASHDDAWNRHDPAMQAALFTADATVVTPSGDRVEGVEAIRELFSQAGPTNDTTSSTRFVGMQQLSAGLVLLDGVQTLEGPGAEIVGSEARIVAVAERRDGRWQLVAARPYVPAGPPAR